MMSKLVLTLVILGIFFFGMVSLFLFFTSDTSPQKDQHIVSEPLADGQSSQLQPEEPVPATPTPESLPPSPEATPTPLTEEEINARFERLYEREQRLGIPVKRGTPLVIELYTSIPPATPAADDGNGQ